MDHLSPSELSSVRKLEEVVLHQERQIQDLSDMVAAQWQEIDKLKKTVVLLQKKIMSVSVDAMEGAGEALSVSEIALRDKPPHY